MYELTNKEMNIKGLVHPKLKILTLIMHLMSFQVRRSFSSEHN